MLDFGADPNGVLDSSPAFSAACVVRGPNGRPKAVYVPAGLYRLNGQVGMSAAQTIYGDGRGVTILQVDQAFSSSALAVIYATPGGSDTGITVRDLGITFVQPTTIASRASMLTLAGGGTSGSGGTGIMYPPAILAVTGSGRTQVHRVRIAGAWDGIKSTTCPVVLDDIEVGALDVGVDLGNDPSGILDFSHVAGYHFWAFGLNLGTTYSSVFQDGQTIGLNLGNCNQLDGRGISLFTGRLVFTSRASAGWFSFTNVGLDSLGATLEVPATGCQWLQIANLYTSGSPAGANVSANPAQLNIAGGLVTITNIKAAATGVSNLRVTGGTVYLTNGELLLSGASTSSVVQTGGVLNINGVGFNTGSGPWTVPLVNSTVGAMQFKNNRFRQPTPGDIGGLVIASDNVAHSVSGNFWNGWKWTPPGTLGSYELDGSVTTLGRNLTGDVALAGGNTGNLLINAAAGTTREVHLQAGGQTVFNAKGAGGTIANYIEALSAAAGGTTWVLGVGSDTNVVLGLNGQGSGGVKVGGTIGFNNTNPVAKPTVTGAKGSNAALASLLSALAAYGLVTDSSSA